MQIEKAFAGKVTMNIYKGLNVLLPAMAILLAGFLHAETWHLDEQGWQSVAGSPEGEYLLATSKIKQQLLSGTGKEVLEALEQLKADFPELTGGEIDGYIKAEKLYAKGDWYKAATLYTRFMDTWPDSVLQPAAMERVYAIGTAFLQGQKRAFLKVLKLPAFDDGVDLMMKLADRAGNAPIALRALTTLAENQERRNKMLDAYHTWSEIADRWPTGETGRNALLRMAQSLHAAYSGPQYDASVLHSAESYYEDFVSRYPEAAQDLEIRQTLDLITQQIAYKQYSMGFYYERTGKRQAAEMYYNKVITDWPDSKASQMAQARLSPDAPPAIKKTVRRRAVNTAGRFLDSWFGIQKLTEKMLPDEPREGGTKNIMTDIEVRESM
jgi:outer membrane protein assembly factor BamD (BamD/ComL family)